MFKRVLIIISSLTIVVFTHPLWRPWSFRALGQYQVVDVEKNVPSMIRMGDFGSIEILLSANSVELGIIQGSNKLIMPLNIKLVPSNMSVHTSSITEEGEMIVIDDDGNGIPEQKLIERNGKRFVQKLFWNTKPEVGKGEN